MNSMEKQVAVLAVSDPQSTVHPLSSALPWDLSLHLPLPAAPPPVEKLMCASRDAGALRSGICPCVNVHASVKPRRCNANAGSVSYT